MTNTENGRRRRRCRGTERIRRMAEKIRNGEPIQGIVDELAEITPVTCRYSRSKNNITTNLTSKGTRWRKLKTNRLKHHLMNKRSGTPAFFLLFVHQLIEILYAKLRTFGNHFVIFQMRDIDAVHLHLIGCSGFCKRMRMLSAFCFPFVVSSWNKGRQTTG